MDVNGIRPDGIRFVVPHLDSDAVAGKDLWMSTEEEFHQ